MENEDCCERGSCEDMPMEDKMSMEMLELANEAWADLLREKMKVLFQEKSGATMDKVATVAVDGCIEYWQKKMAGKECTEEDCKAFSEKLMTAFK